MKTVITHLKHKTVKAFTLLEMLFVLVIISVLLLLFVPNLNNQKAYVENKGNEAIIKVVESQMELYALENGKTPSLKELYDSKYITEQQMAKYEKAKASATQTN